MSEKKILVVEDDPNLNGFYCKYLTKSGYKVETAYSCEEAIDALTFHELPDVVVLDWELCDGDGVEIMSLLEEPEYQSVAVIVCSGHTFPKNYTHHADRIQQFLLKPINPRSLSLLIKAFTGDCPQRVDGIPDFMKAPVYILPSIR